MLKLIANTKQIILQLLFSTVFLFSFSTKLTAQIKVWNNNKTTIGYATQAPKEQLTINGDVFVSPRNSSSGFSFVNYHHDLDSNHVSTNGAVWYDEPMLRPSWQMSMWLGNFDKQLYSVYTRTLYYSLGMYSFSDRRLKSNIKNWQGSALDKIGKINVYRYDLDISKFGELPVKSAEKLTAESRNQIGFMAQEIQNEFPELVKSAKDEGYLAVNYVSMIPILLEAIKEQQVLIKELQAKVEGLENK